MRTRGVGLAAFVVGCFTGGVAVPVSAAERPIMVELNRLEAAASSCRGYFVVRNELPETIDELRLDVFLFDQKGVVLRRVGLTFPDLRAKRSKVILFDLAETPCAEIGRLLVNEVLGCSTAGSTPLRNCPDQLATSSRASATFDY